MKIVTGHEKGVTGVRMWPIHSHIELVAKPYKFMFWKGNITKFLLCSSSTWVTEQVHQHLVSIDMFVANVFATGFLFFSCLQGA